MFWNKDRVIRRKKSVWDLLFLACVIGSIFWVYRHHNQATTSIPLPEEPIAEPEPEAEPVPVDGPKALWCKTLGGSDDIVWSVKTSAAEAASRLPTLLESTLQCPHHLLIYSDWQETIKGHHVIDALDGVDPKIQATHPDFDLWRRLRKGGPDVLTDEEMWESDLTAQKIDKWKMLPMMNKTYHE
jgi:hypothetical protein